MYKKKKETLYNTTCLPISLVDDIIVQIQKQCTSVFHIAYERFWDGYNEMQIRHLFKSGGIKSIELLDSWFIQSLIKKAKGLYEADKIKSEEKGKIIKTVFGGKKNYNLLANNKITKKEFIQKRLSAIVSYGETVQYGNRKFSINAENNEIIFKYNAKNHFIINLPDLRKNKQYVLKALDFIMKEKLSAVSFELTTNQIKISVEEFILNQVIKQIKQEEKQIISQKYKGCKHILCSIDQNPEGIGVAIQNFKSNKIIYKTVINQSEFTKKLGVNISDKRQKYQNNKQKFELIESSKWLINLCKHYHVGKFIIEDLEFKPEKTKKQNKTKRRNQIKGNREGNRLCKNKWNRRLITQYIKKFCLLNNIEVVEINPVYSSFIGNLLYNEYDSIAAAIEIGRRGFYKYQKGLFYPSLIDIETLRNRWKKDLDWKYQTWKELFGIIKDAKLKYRNALTDFQFKVCRLNSDKSCINLYSFI